ncbi:histone-lysine N-methyltransferase SETMAR [Trichonephila clavipes]|nr:histone-lysine N-methyltransferase SETMAR [Trichonephila clavipes]
MLFVRDNDRPHAANIVKQFLAKKGAVQIEHPPFSPDLNSPDFFLFPRLKLALKRKRFDDIPDIQRNATRLLNSISKEDFLKSFQDMYNRSQG